MEKRNIAFSPPDVSEMEIAEELYVYSAAAFLGKNASGKTTAMRTCRLSLDEYKRLRGAHKKEERYLADLLKGQKER